MTGKTRTRFAPSPTGYMHVGNLRTALYAYLKAKSDNGTFILRIEDTDQGRLVEGATDVIYNTLRETGLIWDEGPDIGGDFGPYVQSERMGMFKQYAVELVEKGEAYYCFCEKHEDEETDAPSGALTVVDPCRDIPLDEAKARVANGEAFIIRQKMPKTGTTSFNDVVYGEIVVDNATLEDQVLIKRDGMPTYNFANVVDDHLMAITHVIRGNEYLSSTPKYNLLYNAFGWEIPTYIHCPPVMKDAQNKLSKRNGDASYQDLVAKGYLTEAILNYILLLGWAPKGEEEIFSLDEMKAVFGEDGISKSGAIFDNAKLRYINAEYIRKMSKEEFYSYSEPYISATVKSEVADKKLISELLQARTEVLGEIPEIIDFIDDVLDYDVAMYTHKKMKTNSENSLEMLKAVLPVMENIETWTAENIHEAVFGLIAQMEVKNGLMLWPLRTALSGKQSTPGGGIEIAAIIGKDETIARINKGIEKLTASI